MALKRIHFLSGFVITIFVGLHLFNHPVSILRANVHIQTMNNLRILYRNIFVKTMIMVAMFIQIISGFKFFKISRKTVFHFFHKLHIWTGLYLTVFLIIHLCAVYVGHFLLYPDMSFYFGVASINTFPFNLFFVPYYGLAILSFFGYISTIQNKKMKRTFFWFPPNTQSFIILFFAFILTNMTFYGLTNRYNGV